MMQYLAINNERPKPLVWTRRRTKSRQRRTILSADLRLTRLVFRPGSHVNEHAGGLCG
jgi:hypothetical protein